MAAAYTILGENRFKIIAYENAATSVEHATSELKDLWDDGKLDTVPGLGAALISHLDEIFRTGKSKHFKEVLGKVNPAVFPLLEVPGIGPKKALQIVQTGKIPEYLLPNIEKYKKGRIKEKRMGLPEADAVANEILGYLGGLGGLEKLKIDKLGSLKRRVATIGDIDLAVATNEPEKAIEAFVAYPKASSIIEKGPTGASILLGAVQIDLRVAKPEEYGAMLQYFTGSKDHNIKLRELALKKGYTLSEYGLKLLKSPKLLKFKTEEELYQFLGLDFIPPELREDAGEIEAALKINHVNFQGKLSGLPKLVELKDIKGDLHLHSNFDLETSHDAGEGTVGEMREMGENKGYEYVGISDHNPSVAKHSPKQVEENLQARKKSFEQLNYSTKGCRVINLLEVDILPDGSLPISQKGLDCLDGCLVSVHSSFSLDREKMTTRILRGLSNPVARILGHPTGRLLNEREGYELDWDQIFAFCLKYDKALEINCFPNRLDLPDVLVREAVKRGILLSLGTDAHTIADMNLIRFGVDVAHRGWAQKENIINTWDYSKITQWLNIRRS